MGRLAVALLLYRLNCSASSSALVKCFRMTVRLNYTFWSKATCSILGTKIRASFLIPHTYSENSGSYTHMYVFRLNSAPQKELCAFMLIAKNNCYVRPVRPSVRPRSTAGHPVDGFSWNSVSAVLYCNMSTQFHSIFSVCPSRQYTQLSVCSKLSVVHLTALTTTSFLIYTACSTCLVLWCCSQVQQRVIKWEMMRM
jgi:hypothetical protein